MTKLETTFIERPLILDINTVARQADGSALVRYGETMVLATAVLAKEPKESDFLPLTVEYRERTYAAGKIPGGFFKREGRPREKETQTARLIDRSIRPLFPKHLRHEVQVAVTVLSHDQENDTDFPSLLATSAALAASRIPFQGPVAGVRIGRTNGKISVNPTLSELEASDLDLVVSGHEGALVMVEGQAREVPEPALLEALKTAHEKIRELCSLLNRIPAVPKMELPPPPSDPEVEKGVEEAFTAEILSALEGMGKQERNEAMDALRRKAKEMYPEKAAAAVEALEKLLARLCRERILKEGRRADGRGPKEIRPISIQVGLLPRAHGSALFTRGQTQAMVAATLGTSRDQQIMDDLEGEYRKRFMLHYNFPPFSTGEVKPFRGPGRREIGHGLLAERSLEPLLPPEQEFPYAIRVVSDILESNGSSSMASVCGGTLALMDAGVPLVRPVAGIAMGLIQEKDRHAILTDILGMEDHIGDMDFKVAGTEKGVTGIQMDIKITGLKMDLLQEALEQAREARMFVLEKMKEALPAPRSEVREHAPKLTVLSIPPSKIGDLIGPGGKNIRKIMADTGAEIEVEDDGRIFITAPTTEAMQAAKETVSYYTQEVEVGKIYKGKVASIVKFGAFVTILPGKDGLCHISQLDENRVQRVEDVVREGQEVWVKVTEIDKMGRINLSRKLAMREMQGKDGGGSGPQS